MNDTQIPGLRAMAIVRWLIVVSVGVVALATWWRHPLHAAAPVAAAARFQCPMHPEIKSAEPGDCPICGMKLEPVTEERLGPLELTPERRAAAGIVTAPAERRPIARELRWPAVVEPSERGVSEVRARVPGYIEKVEPVETGDRVRAGQALVWVSSPEIVRAEEELVAATRTGSSAFGASMIEAAVERLRLLGLDEDDIARVRSERRAARAIAIRAPMDGVVVARDASVGSYTTAEKLLFRVVDLSRLWITATAPAAELAGLPRELVGRFSASADGRALEVRSSLIEPSIALETRTGRVRFVAQNGEGQLRPGQIGEVMVGLPAEERVLVPRDAVIDVGKRRYVYVELAEGRLEPRPVELGPLIGEERVILAGLEAGERVITRGAFLLDSESRLRGEAAP